MQEINWDGFLTSPLDMDFEGSTRVLRDQLMNLLSDLNKNGLSVEVITPNDKVQELLEQIEQAESEHMNSPIYIDPAIIWAEHDELIDTITEMKQRNDMSVLVKMYSFDARLIREAAKIISCFIKEYYPKCRLNIDIVEFEIDMQGGQYKKYLTINFSL